MLGLVIAQVNLLLTKEEAVAGPTATTHIKQETTTPPPPPLSYYKLSKFMLTYLGTASEATHRLARFSARKNHFITFSLLLHADLGLSVL
jgi:hypothetical protein